MKYGPIGIIKALLETFLDAMDPYPNKRKNVVHGDKTETGWSMQELSDAYVAAQNDPGEKYWQDLLEQHLDEKEREAEIVSEMIIKDYESRHESESGQDSGAAETAEEENAAEGDSTNNADFESDVNDSGNYDGYIG